MRELDLGREVTWRGAVGVQREPSGWQPWRLPPRQAHLFPGGDLVQRARMPAGVRLGVRTTARRVSVTLVVEEPDCAPVDIVVGGEHRARRAVTSGAPIELDLGAAAAREVWWWLPQYGQCRVASLCVEPGAEVDQPGGAGPAWVTYGSSITQGRQADGPLDTWPARIARASGLSLTNLGFGGQCLLDPMVARVIASLPAAVISLCLGVNVFGQASHGPRTLVPAVLGFLAQLREGHPHTPLVVITPLATRWSPERRNAAGMTLGEVAAAVLEAGRLWGRSGDAGVKVVPGWDLLGPQDTDTLVDDVHPGSTGHALIAARLGPTITGQLQG